MNLHVGSFAKKVAGKNAKLTLKKAVKRVQLSLTTTCQSNCWCLSVSFVICGWLNLFHASCRRANFSCGCSGGTFFKHSTLVFSLSLNTQEMCPHVQKVCRGWFNMKLLVGSSVSSLKSPVFNSVRHRGQRLQSQRCSTGRCFNRKNH